MAAPRGPLDAFRRARLPAAALACVAALAGGCGSGGGEALVPAAAERLAAYVAGTLACAALAAAAGEEGQAYVNCRFSPWPERLEFQVAVVSPASAAGQACRVSLDAQTLSVEAGGLAFVARFDGDPADAARTEGGAVTIGAFGPTGTGQAGPFQAVSLRLAVDGSFVAVGAGTYADAQAAAAGAGQLACR